MTKKIKRRIIVDMWGTPFHGEEVGIEQKDDYRAKEPQFSKDIDLFGEIKEDLDNKEKTIGYIGLRTTLWEEPKDELEKRLVIKLFSKSMYYYATLEEIISRELIARTAWNLSYPCFNIIQEDNPYVLRMDKVKRNVPLLDWFVLLYITEERFTPILIKHRIDISPSSYKIIKVANNKEIGTIQGKILDVGGQTDIVLKSSDEKLINDDHFVRALILFAASERYHEEIEEKTERAEKLYQKGEWDFSMDSNEKEFYINPRKMKRK